MFSEVKRGGPNFMHGPLFMKVCIYIISIMIELEDIVRVIYAR
jgi:hypothetical protein